MRRATLNFIVDPGRFCELTPIGGNGFCHEWVLPPGSGGGGGGRGYDFRGGRGPGPGAGQVKQLLGLGRHD